MDFKKRVKIIKKILFVEYERTYKIKEDDWIDEANELSNLISNTKDSEYVVKLYSEKLTSFFPDDTYTNFEPISRKIVDALNSY